jgi:hypothetical protein
MGARHPAISGGRLASRGFTPRAAPRSESPSSTPSAPQRSRPTERPCSSRATVDPRSWLARSQAVLTGSCWNAPSGISPRPGCTPAPLGRARTSCPWRAFDSQRPS